MKLWQKDISSVNEIIEAFTVGRDKEFDMLLAAYDVEGSIAHVTMLGEVGLMTKAEAESAIKELNNILIDIRESRFRLDAGVEDVHSQIELLLTQRIGETGKKFIVVAVAMTRWPLISNYTCGLKFARLLPV